MVERRRIGDNLSQEEMSNLLNFEEHETQSTPKAAARKSEVTKGSHLATHHQPRIEHERDGDSRGSGELFHASKGPPHAQPLLTAVTKAGEQANAAEHAEKTEAGNGDGSASDDGSSTSSGDRSCESDDSSKSQVRRQKAEQKNTPDLTTSQPMEPEGEGDDSSLYLLEKPTSSTSYWIAKKTARR